MASTKAFATLLDTDVPDNQKRDQSRTIYTDAVIPNQENNLADWLIGLEIENTGISKVNSGEITLRIDERGTFVRSDPILVNEDSKNKYMIEIQLKQDLDNDDDFNDPTEQGIVLRGLIGQPSVVQNSSYGEILRIPLISVQYRLKEMVTSRWLLFNSPSESFSERVSEINIPYNYPVRSTTIANNLPTSPLLSYKPTGPKSIHDSMAEIIDALSNPQVDGGAFDDYYFEIENNPSETNYLDITADKFGSVDSGVIIDPLSLDVEDTGEENTTVTDNITYKNHVIVIGDQKSGSLPMERTRFASNFQHAIIRYEWDSGTTYQAGDLVKHITSANNKPHLITYHRSLTDSNTGNNPISTHGTNWEIDFTDIPPFITTSDAYYKVGEIVSHENGGTIYFYQCNEEQSYTTTHFSSSSPPTPPSGWSFITSISSTFYEPFVSYSPWTNDVDIWKQTLAGRGDGTANYAPTIDSTKYQGWAWDWNVTKSNFNRENLHSSFEEISPKVITGFTSQFSIVSESGVPSKMKYDSNRLLIDSAGSAPWLNNLNKIAEYDASTGTWQLSKEAVSGDTVINLFDAKIWKFNGSAWEAKWDPLDSANNDKPTPFHLCKNVGLIAGATGIAGQAVEFDYDWFVAVPVAGDEHPNRTSRGVWISSTALLPRHDTNQYDVGELYGGTPSGGSKHLGTIDTNNYDKDRKGFIGWNKGIDDEDYGRISALAFKMRVSFFKTRDGGGLIHGIPDIPMTFWAIDKFDRVWFHRFKLKRNGEWDDVTIPIGELAMTNLHHARWDELATFFDGVPITGLDFTIKEREFSGIAFDWKYMKYWGVQLDESYTGVGLYKNGLERAFEYGEDLMADLAGNLWYQGGALIYNVGGYIFGGSDFQAIPATQNFIRLSARIAIDDLHFQKELLATSSDTSIQNARTEVQYVGNEVDYVNLKTRAKARVARQKFFPQTVHIRTSGDVRLRFGQSFKVSGSRVIENPNNYPDWSIGQSYVIGDKVDYLGYTYQALTNNTNQIPLNSPNDWENLNKYVVSNVRHIFNHDGYFCEVAGFRKFVVSG